MPRCHFKGWTLHHQKRKINNELQHPLKWSPVLSLKALKWGICPRVRTDMVFPWKRKPQLSAMQKTHLEFLCCQKVSSHYDMENWKLMFLQETPPSSSHFMRYSKFQLTENVNYRCIFSHHWYLIIDVFGRDKTQSPTSGVTLVFPLLRNTDFATFLTCDSTPNSERSYRVCFGKTPPNYQGRSEERAPKTYVELHAVTGTRAQIFHRKRAALQTQM